MLIQKAFSGLKDIQNNSVIFVFLPFIKSFTRMKKIGFLLALICPFILFGCKPKQQETTEEKDYNYPITIISDTLKTDLSDKTELYPLSEDFMESFIEKHNDYQGHKITANIPFPEEWGLQCVERLPEGKELWLLQSQSREWMYLVITSGFGTQRILDLMPVALNLANESNDVLETEEWNTIRMSDGSFVVNKNYEWVRSVSNATRQQVLDNPEKYHRESHVTESFIINDMGRFEFVEETDTIPDYNAVVFFYNRNEKPEMWDECVERLQSFCEENNILFEEVYQNYNQVLIQNFNLTFSATVDITPYVGNTYCGMVMMNGEDEPKTINFGSYEYMQMSIRRYFHLVENDINL